MNKVRVEFKSDCMYGDYKKGDCGFVDGYIFHQRTEQPMVCVVVLDRIVLAPFNHLTVTENSKENL